MAYTIIEDVRDRLPRPLSADEERTIPTRIEDVERLIRTRMIALDAQIHEGHVDSGVVRQVVADSIIRVLNNPEGKLTERIDDYSWTRDSSTSSGRLWITDGEWELLMPQSRGTAFNITPVGGVGSRSNPPWWPQWYSEYRP